MSDVKSSKFYIATSPVNRQYDAMWEVEWALGECRVKRTPFRGVFTIEAFQDAIEKIREYETTAIYKVIPLDSLVRTEFQEILQESLKIAKEKLKSEKTFAVRCKKRDSHLSSREVEKKLGAEISKEIGSKVDLTKPDVLIKIEVLGRKTGIGVLKPEEILVKEVLE
ncbi:MAG: THUMP domain-containing protein [Candidatus Methanofastidiosia archaeon]